MKPVDFLPIEAQSRVPADVMQKLQDSRDSLEAALLNKDPMMKEHLRESHRLLISYPETVHLLDDDEIKLLLDAAMKQMQIQIVSDTVKKTKASKTKPSVDDL